MSYWTKLENINDEGEGMMLMCVCFANDVRSPRDDSKMVISDTEENIPPSALTDSCQYDQLLMIYRCHRTHVYLHI
jgi:hypothetical protein